MEQQYNNYGMPGMYNSNPYFVFQPQMQRGPFNAPQTQNALTNEEIQQLKYKRPSSALDLDVDPSDVLRAMCTHRDNGTDVVQLLNDGRVHCPICGASWETKNLSKDDVKQLVDELIDIMESAKWIGDFPINTVRNYFTLIPMLKKFPDLYEYASKNFDRFYSQKGFVNAPDANIHAAYNGLFSGTGYPQYSSYMPPQAQGYYAQAPQGFVPAAPGVNPMQAPVYGVPPQQPINPQFVNQANMMMQGTVYPQQMAPQGQMIDPNQNPAFMPQANPYMMGQQPQVNPQQNNGQQPYNPVYGNPQQNPNVGQPQNNNTTQAAPAANEPKMDL